MCVNSKFVINSGNLPFMLYRPNYLGSCKYYGDNIWHVSQLCRKACGCEYIRCMGCKIQMFPEVKKKNVQLSLFDEELKND